MRSDWSGSCGLYCVTDVVSVCYASHQGFGWLIVSTVLVPDLLPTAGGNWNWADGLCLSVPEFGNTF